MSQRMSACSATFFILILIGVAICHANAPAGAKVDPARAAKLRDICANAQHATDHLTDYRVRFHRREMINDKQGKEETLMLTIRSKPFCVHVKCLAGSENEGREMLYDSSKAGASMHVLTGRGDVIAGLHMELGIRSERVMASTRHSIDEAGFAHATERLGIAVEQYLTGQPKASQFEPLGLQTRSESRVPMEVMLQHIPAQQEPLLPHGGKRYWHFNADPDVAERFLPTLVVTFDDRGRQVEYYFYDRLLPKVLLEMQDFDAEKRWGKP
jgi:hypothetical protein